MSTNDLWDWLTVFDQHCTNIGMEIKDRPWDAFVKISTAKHMARSGQESPQAVPLSLVGKEFRDIYDWYAKKYPQLFKIPINTKIPFFHNGFFWAIDICMILGKTSDAPVNDIIHSMPESEFKSLEKVNLEGYHHFWADCVDYIFGYDFFLKTEQTGLGKNVLIAADEHLKIAAFALFQSPPQAMMVHSAVLAVEMYLKGFLCIKKSLTEEQLKKDYGHKLGKLIDSFLEIEPTSRLKSAKQAMLRWLPSVNNRYVPSEDTPFGLWEVYRIAQFTTAEVLRFLSGSDVRKRVESLFPGYAVNEFDSLESVSK